MKYSLHRNKKAAATLVCLVHKCLFIAFRALGTNLIAQTTLHLSMKTKFPSRLVYEAPINLWTFMMTQM